jgi:dihydroorotase
MEALIERGHLGWPALIRALTVGPAKLLNLDAGTLSVGAAADVTLIDPAAEWTIDAGHFLSRSRNTPFHGRRVRGRIACTIVSGEVRHRLLDK